MDVLPLRAVRPTSTIIANVTQELLRRRQLLKNRDTLKCLLRCAGSDFAPRSDILLELRRQVDDELIKPKSITKLRLLHDTISNFPNADRGKREMQSFVLDKVLALDLSEHAPQVGVLWAMACRVQSPDDMEKLMTKLSSSSSLSSALNGQDARFTLDALLVSPEKERASQFIRREELVDIILSDMEMKSQGDPTMNFKIAAVIAALDAMEAGPALDARERRLVAVLDQQPPIVSFGHLDVRFSVPTLWAAMNRPRVLPYVRQAVENDLSDVLRSEAAYILSIMTKWLRQPSTPAAKDLLAEALRVAASKPLLLHGHSAASILPWCTLWMIACKLDADDVAATVKSKISTLVARGASTGLTVTNPGVMAIVSGCNTHCGKRIGPFDKLVLFPAGRLTQVLSSRMATACALCDTFVESHDLGGEVLQVLEEQAESLSHAAASSIAAAVRGKAEGCMALPDRLVSRLEEQAMRMPVRST